MQLVKYDHACRALAEAKSVDEVKDMRDKAQAINAYARQAKNKQLEIDAAEIRIRAERRLGELLEETNPHGGDRKSSCTQGNLKESGIDSHLSSRSRGLASIPEEEFEATLAEHREEQKAVTGRTMERLSKKAHVANNSGNNEWYTPTYILDAAREALGGIDFDPASSETANKTVQADEYLTIEDDGLTAQWHGRVWLNPPYSQPEIADFCAAAVEAYRAGHIDAACILTNNATETAWLQSLFGEASSVCFLRGRVKYLNEQGEPANSPLQGQCVTYLGKEHKNFRNAFKDLGVVWQ